MPLSTLAQDLFFLQHPDPKRRYQQFVLSFALGFTRSLDEIPNDENILKIRSFQEFCKKKLVDLGDSVKTIPRPTLHATADLDGLFNFSGQAILYLHLEPSDVSRKKIIAVYEKLFSKSRKVWKDLQNADQLTMNYYVERSKTIFDSRLNRQQTSNHLSSPMPVPTQHIHTHAEDRQMPEVRTTPRQTPHLIKSHVAYLAPTPSDEHIQEQMTQSNELQDEITQVVGLQLDPIPQNFYPRLTDEQADAAFAQFLEEL